MKTHFSTTYTCSLFSTTGLDNRLMNGSQTSKMMSLMSFLGTSSVIVFSTHCVKWGIGVVTVDVPAGPFTTRTTIRAILQPTSPSPHDNNSSWFHIFCHSKMKFFKYFSFLKQKTFKQNFIKWKTTPKIKMQFQLIFNYSLINIGIISWKLRTVNLSILYTWSNSSFFPPLVVKGDIMVVIVCVPAESIFFPFRKASRKHIFRRKRISMKHFIKSKPTFEKYALAHKRLVFATKQKFQMPLAH